MNDIYEYPLATIPVSPPVMQVSCPLKPKLPPAPPFLELPPSAEAPPAPPVVYVPFGATGEEFLSSLTPAPQPPMPAGIALS